MSKYLLPCECGKGIAIDASQAGQQLACECGKLLEVPTLRGVRELQPAPEAASSRRPAAEWDSSRGMIFAGSLILVIIGAAMTYLGFAGLRTTPNITRELETETFDQRIDDMPLEEVYETWKEIREHGLGERGQDIYVNIRSFRAGRQRLLVIGIVLCVGGLFAAIGATLGRRKSPA
jgi:hypothetical protein